MGTYVPTTAGERREVAIAYPAYIREKARRLRRERKLTIDELAERLAIPRTTIYYWVRDIAIDRKPASTWPATASQAAARSNRRRFKALRDAAYEEGRARFTELSREPGFRDFVILFIAEGYKRSRNHVSISNSDPAVMAVAVRWMSREADRPMQFSVQYHADQDLASLRTFWGRQLGIDPDSITLQRKSNSGGLRGRTWRSRYGVLTARTSDTYFRARLQAWVDRVREQWLDSPEPRGVAQPGSASRLGREGRRFKSARPDSSPVRKAA
jgi:AcrR family transcriptional regulator